MGNEAKDINQMKTDIAVLNKDVSQIAGLFDRFDITIDKLSDLATSLRQLIAVHEERLEQHSRQIAMLAAAAEKRRGEYQKSESQIYKELTKLQIKVAVFVVTASLITAWILKSGILSGLF